MGLGTGDGPQGRRAWKTRVLLYAVVGVVFVYSLWPILTMFLEGYNVDLGAVFAGKAIRFIGGLSYSGGINPTPYYFLQALGAEAYPRLALNTLVVSALSISIALAVGIPAAYALARLDVRGKTLVSYLLLALRTVSQFVVIIPLYITYSALGLYDTFPGIALAEQMLILSVAVWMLKGFFADVPRDVYEAATLFGKREWQTFRRVVLPMVAPGIVVTTMFALVLIWNDFLIADSLTGAATKTVAVGVWEGLSITQLSFSAVTWNGLNAAGTLAYIPAMAVMLAVRKYLARGFSLGLTD